LDVVKKVFPESQIIENCVDKYPIQVIVTAQHNNDNDNDKVKVTEIWSGRQQDLFKKYVTKRTNSIKQINSSLEEFKKKSTM